MNKCVRMNKKTCWGIFMTVSGIYTSNPYQCTLQTTSKQAMGHRLGAPKMGDICGALVSLTSFLSSGDKALGTPSLTKLEARVVIKENWRQTQNIGKAKQQLPPTPIPGSFHPRGGSLSLNCLLPHKPQALALHTALCLSTFNQNHGVLL